jgi:hypothetical protein
VGRPIKDNIMFFSHDANASRHWKFSALRAHYGDKGWAMEGRYWSLNGMIAEAEGCRLDLKREPIRIDTANNLGLSLEELNEFIHFLSDPGACDLLNSDNGNVWTDRCDEELRSARKAREADRRRKGEFSDRNPTGKASYPVGIRSENPCIPAGKGGFSGEEAKPSLEKPREAASPENPAAQPPFATLLKTSLEAASILISQSDLDACASKLIACSADSEPFILWALAKCAKAKQRGTWFVKGVLAWDWVEKWRSAGNGAGSSPKQAEPYSPPPLHVERTPEDEAAVELAAAKAKATMRAPLSGRERELLGLPAPPVVEQPLDDFEDDIPEAPA